MVCYYHFDVYAFFLKGNVIIVDTPGIGENSRLDNILLDFLPHAVSFVFIVNAKNAGGIHEERVNFKVSKPYIVSISATRNAKYFHISQI